MPPLPPKGGAPDVPSHVPRGIVWGAALAMLAFSALTWIALAAWFKVAAEPWTWRSIVTIFAAAASLTTSVLVWRAPSRPHAIAGVVVMLLSLVRVGGPGDWSWTSFLMILITGLLMVPIVRAAIVLPWAAR